MKTDWSVIAFLAVLPCAGCRTPGATTGASYAWMAGDGDRTVASKDSAPPGALTREASVARRRERITVTEAVAEALAANRTVGQSRLAAAIERTREHEARAALRPALNFTGFLSQRDQAPGVDAPELGTSFSTGPTRTLSMDLGLTFPIFAFGKYLNAHRAAKLTRQSAQAKTRATEADIAAAVTAAAFDLLLTIRSVEVARTNETALERQVQDSQALLTAGRVTRSALLEAQVEYERAKRDREKAESLVSIRRMTLNQILGRPTDMATEIVDDPATRAPHWDLAQLQVEAQNQRPELRSARLRLQSAMSNLKAIVGAVLPEVRGSLTYSATDSEFVTPRNFLTLGVVLNIPLYTGGANYARVRRARRQVEMARLAKLDLEARIQTEVARTHRAVIESFKDIAVARRSIDRAEESLRIQREKYSSGRATSREVLDSTALLTSARVDYIRALYSYNNALRELHRARGADPGSSPLPEEE